LSITKWKRPPQAENVGSIWVLLKGKRPPQAEILVIWGSDKREKLQK